MNRFTIFAIPFLAIFFLVACDSGKPQAVEPFGRNKVYNGTLNIVADPGLESVIRQEIEIFKYLHDSISVNVEFKDEAAMFRDVREGKAEVIILTRLLTQEEKQKLAKQDTLYLRELEVARDAIALVANKSFDDSKLDTIQLKKFMTDENNPANPVLVFDNQNSSIVKHLFKWAGRAENNTRSVYAVASPKDVVDYVEQKPNSLGFLPYGYVSDEDDLTTQEVAKRVKILSLHAHNEEGKAIRTSATQSDIADGTYPLLRSVNVLIGYGYKDNSEWLFMNFLFREKGAKIFLKAGFVPVRIPQRELNVNTGEIPANKLNP